jgi:hypothetical protein
LFVSKYGELFVEPSEGAVEVFVDAGPLVFSGMKIVDVVI